MWGAEKMMFLFDFAATNKSNKINYADK